ncbi:MAG: hypothetical protein AB7K68_17465 [Bacteriovoracia bacterium]
MKTLFLSLFLATLVAQQAMAANEISANDEAFQISSVQINEVVPTAAELYSAAVEPRVQPRLQMFEIGGIEWSTLVTIGEKLIEIIKAGAPVVNIKRDVISVVPQGITSWEQLSNWQVPLTKVYEVKATNGWGSDVVKVRLKVSAMTGGGVEGRGQYVANVTIVPTEIVVQWGFSLDVWSENRPAVNMGTTAMPVAGLGFDIRYKVTSLFTQKNGTQDYFITGAGQLIEMQ